MVISYNVEVVKKLTLDEFLKQHPSLKNAANVYEELTGVKIKDDEKKEVKKKHNSV